MELIILLVVWLVSAYFVVSEMYLDSEIGLAFGGGRTPFFVYIFGIIFAPFILILWIIQASRE